MKTRYSQTIYPTSLISEVELLEPDTQLSGNPNVELLRLSRHNLYAAVGLSRDLQRSIASAALEPHIAEMCPNDGIDIANRKGRFNTRENASAWIAKGGGRGVVSISSAEDDTLLAYGWSGYDHNYEIPGADITTAYRVTEAGRKFSRQLREEHAWAQEYSIGQSIGQLVLGAAVMIYKAPAKDISLETWSSNKAAAALYQNLGFTIQKESKPEDRVTTMPVGTLVNGYPVRINTHGLRVVHDQRHHYRLTHHEIVE